MSVDMKIRQKFLKKFDLKRFIIPAFSKQELCAIEDVTID